MEDFLKPLDDIKRVDVASFLFTRIQQRIQNELGNRVSIKTAYSIAASFAVLFALNIFIVVNNKSSRVEGNNIAQAFHLIPNNNLYE